MNDNTQLKEDIASRDMVLSVLSAVLCPVLCFVGIALLEAKPYFPLLITWFTIAFAHAVLAILFGLKGFCNAGSADLPVSAKVSSILAMLFASFILFMWLVGLPAVTRAREAIRPGCENNLKMWGIIHKMYASDHENRFPALSASPGQLSPDFPSVYPEYVTDLSIYQCNNIREDFLEQPYDSPFLSVVSDHSFFYLGYILDGPKSLRAFHDAYARIIAAGGNFEFDLEVPKGTGSWGSDRLIRLNDASETFSKVPGDTEREITSVDTPRNQSEIPVMIERPGHHIGAGSLSSCKILFMDGHVEQRRYPGEWPLTEEAIELLTNIDRTGPHLPGSDLRLRSRPTSPYLWLLPFVAGIGVFVLLCFIRSSATSIMKFYGVAVTVFGLVICVIPSPDQSKEASQLSIHYPDGTVVDVESVLDPY